MVGTDCNPSASSQQHGDWAVKRRAGRLARPPFIPKHGGGRTQSHSGLVPRAGRAMTGSGRGASAPRYVVLRVSFA
jgi:hypothetical protein